MNTRVFLSRSCLTWLFLFCLSLAVPAQAQFQLVADVNQTPNLEQSKPVGFTQLGSEVLFVATTATHGRELWKTDGTEGGTALLKDVRPGNISSNPTILGVAGGIAFFTANDGVTGNELWKTDGTEAGTVLVKDILPGVDSGCFTNTGLSIIHDGKLFITAQDYDRNSELWVSDGTGAGTQMVKDLRSNTVNPGSSPGTFASVGTTLFFAADTDAAGRELWKTDGTNAGTVMVKDILPGSSGSSIQTPVGMGGVLYFGASNGTNVGANGYELWKSDGTTGGTVMVKEFVAGTGGGGPSGMVVMGGMLYFSATSTLTFNRELWKSDGTDAGTVLVKEIRPAVAQFQGSDPFGLKVVGSMLYFFANDGTTGIELWKSDGSEAGTAQVRDLLTGTGFGARVDDPGSPPPMIEAIGSTVYFYGNDGTTGGELWKTDGTPGGTVLVEEIVAGAGHAQIREMKALGTEVYFSALQPGGGTEPYISDGSEAGTGMLKDIGTGSAGSNPDFLTPVAGGLYFKANDGVNGAELWVKDQAGVRLTLNTNPAITDNGIGGVGALNGTAVYGSAGAASSYHLWNSDGTAPGTRLMAQTPPIGPLGFIPGGEAFATGGNLLYFQAFTTTQGGELWRTDGTSAGTFILRDFFPGPDDGDIREMQAIGNILYFVADTDDYGKEVWRTDGTAAGTKLLKDVDAGWTGSDPTSLCALGKTLYFSASGPVGSELYKSDGTAGGTVMVKDVNPDGSSFAGNITAINSTTVLFSAFRQSFEGMELWKSNGTAAGTVLVKDIYPGFLPSSANRASSSPAGIVSRGEDAYAFAVLNGFAYFRASTATHGSELWKSDGTDGGTTIVKDIVPGPLGSTPYEGIVVGSKLYFLVTISGASQLWETDGTEVGTVPVDDSVTNVTRMVMSGTSLLVVGERSDVGREVFELVNVRPNPITITQSPNSQNLPLNAALTLTAAVTAPVGHTVQWRKDGVAIPGATQLTYKVAKATEIHQGRYDLLVKFEDLEALSDPADVTVTDPAAVSILFHPQPRLVNTGGSASFEVRFTSSTAVSFQWYKGATLIPGATSNPLVLSGIQMTDAGLYKVKLTNSVGSVTSNAAQLAVVDNTVSLTFIGKANAPLSIPAPPISGTGLTFQWLSGNTALFSADGYSGVTTTKLGINKHAFNTSYRLMVSLGGQAVFTAAQQARVVAIPAVTAVAVGLRPKWIISGPVNLLVSSLLNQSNLTGAPQNAPTAFTVSKLPAGLKYDPATRSIVGRPTAGGGTTVTLLIKATNVGGTSSEVSVAITIANLDPLCIGEFRGLVPERNAMTGGLGQAVTLTVGPVGTFTGSLQQGTKKFGFSGAVNSTAAPAAHYVTPVQVKRTGSTELTLTLTYNPTTGAYTGTVTDNTLVSNIPAMRRMPWTKTNLANDHAAPYTAALQPGGAQVGDEMYPQGDGYLLLSLTNLGAVTGTCRLSDGSPAVTFSTLFDDQGVFPLYVPAYSDTGSAFGFVTTTLNVGGNLLDSAAINWSKAPQPAASTTRSYKTGIPEHSLTLVGGEWIKPTGTNLVLGMTVTTTGNNARLEFTGPRMSEVGAATAGVLAQLLRVNSPAHSTLFPTPNTLAYSLKINPANGEFTGGWKTKDTNPQAPPPTVERPVLFGGAIILRLNEGRGHHNLARLPHAGQTNATKTEMLSGRALLQKVAVP